MTSFADIKLKALDAGASQIHPLTLPTTSKPAPVRQITYHLTLNQAAPSDWATALVKRWKDDGMRNEVLVDANVIKLTSHAAQIEQDIRQLESSINAANKSYRAQMAAEALEAQRVQTARASIEALAQSLVFK